MQITVIDKMPDMRSAVAGRVQEGLRQAGMRRAETRALEPTEIETHDWSMSIGCIIGPGCYSMIDQTVDRVKHFFDGTIGVILENQVYAGEALTLKRRLNVEVMSLSDLAQIANFLLLSDSNANAEGAGRRHRGVVGFCQFKGGVGTTTLTAALASCWARNGLTVAAIDLDDVNPQLSAWGRVGATQRALVSECLRSGNVPPYRMNEIVAPVEGYDGRLVVVGQPELYNDGFHFKAPVIEDAPSVSQYLGSLIDVLRPEFDVVVIDFGRSWGVASFAALPLCQHLLLVTDDDGMSVRATLDGLSRLKKESDDPEEFDLKRWAVVLNAYTGVLLTPKDIEREVSALNLLPPDADLFAIPFSQSGRQWGAPGQALYDVADGKTRSSIESVARNLISFRLTAPVSMTARLRRRVGAMF